ncbi:MAG TPA: FeoA family protein [Caulobacteraceae bacterium]|nr:FeoA family protein [Caulobacteraceae bacterium]
MRRFSEFDLPNAPGVHDDSPPSSLSAARKGFSGVIVAVRPAAQAGGLDEAEIERRLVEMGFVEGAPVQLVHEGLIGRDPIAVKLADRTVALRRREAGAVLVRALEPAK